MESSRDTKIRLPVAPEDAEGYKSLNKARQENEGVELKHFEAMDLIYSRVRNRTNDGLTKLESLMKPQAHALYYDKKAELYSLLQEKKK
jgi:urease gamma subunit